MLIIGYRICSIYTFWYFYGVMSYSDIKVTGIIFLGVVDSSEYTLDRLFWVSTIKSGQYTSTLNKMARDYFKFLLWSVLQSLIIKAEVIMEVYIQSNCWWQHGQYQSSYLQLYIQLLSESSDGINVANDCLLTRKDPIRSNTSMS